MKRLLLAAVIVLIPTGALAQQACAPAEKVEQVLAQYGETRLGVGVSSRGHLISVFVNPITRTWSVTGRSPQMPGQLCLFDSGTEWEFGALGEDRPESR